MVSGYLVNYFLSRTTEIRFETSDAKQTISLPDGSSVTLNKNSQITYRSDFGKHDRNIALKGEAFFDVERDTLKPFVIAVNKATIEVLGTSFNVRAYDHLAEVEVIVKTGVVKLSVPDRKTEVKLNAGQKGIYEKENQALHSGVNEDINFLSWNTQKIIFMESDLRTVIETLNKT
jgi:ferric-dicitrate binding protein FerR (iron transport regulator)